MGEDTCESHPYLVLVGSCCGLLLLESCVRLLTTALHSIRRRLFPSEIEKLEQKVASKRLETERLNYPDAYVQHTRAQRQLIGLEKELETLRTAQDAQRGGGGVLLGVAVRFLLPPCLWVVKTCIVLYIFASICQGGGGEGWIASPLVFASRVYKLSTELLQPLPSFFLWPVPVKNSLSVPLSGWGKSGQVSTGSIGESESPDLDLDSPREGPSLGLGLVSLLSLSWAFVSRLQEGVGIVAKKSVRYYQSMQSKTRRTKAV
uniref:Uncharacterized protein n=1 Tax=Chromera velia CCMP2878 TaxID=1169474 RepID=A0A0G4FWL6_9ALVE|mmetsp:Transcript_55246/g.108073  ORF Transcript_55246/g.108073 Transcript_55246/m.108073 type:complete len:261 (-) Transcript_55246:12-794(-)|eukprot:Cvel_19112.t1-p1 / transcript=Cvel_19112.t1 / gene=Cvel_19112 / organism=Chromera_velia_CCMP2878 / gene_product=hypothetical protein / transcript_product=hypothetical protein / location=Cvel_scaffold1623:23845-26803(-) / protein_length=260 / sequence_SO=supercontig / SO=protein_coding / is_pseudo=false